MPEDAASKLEDIASRVRVCTRCELCRGRTNAVPGDGNPNAEIMFIGEAPGYNEAVQRRPFVGRSGQLFRKVLQDESGIDPAQVYISNIVKVRPPDNRDPLPAEIAAFKPFLDREIAIIEPPLRIILAYTHYTNGSVHIQMIEMQKNLQTL